MNLRTSPLSTVEKQIVSRYLQLIKSLSIAIAPTHGRLIIAGGFGADGAIGQITRPHRDLDAQVFCQEPNVSEYIKKLVDKLKVEYPQIKFVDGGRTEYYHLFKLTIDKDLEVELYYVITLESPFESPKITIKKDGSYSEPGEFNTIISHLEDTIFESVAPSDLLADLLSKQKSPGLESVKHLQDIENLKHFLTPA